MIHENPDVQRFVEVTMAEGVPGGLRLLNQRVPHRYTALYALRGGVLKNLFLYDKAGEARPEFLEEVPIGDSFCQFVLRDGCFLTSDTGSDHRLDGHAYQGVLRAYHGVPLVGDDGELFGTLCHFDARECDLSEDEFQYLQKVTRLLPACLPKVAR